MDKKTQKILRELQDGFKLETRPFMRIANELDCTEDEVIRVIEKYREEGVIRRIGVAVHPEKLGHSYNVLVAWKVPEDRLEEIGSQLSLIRAISHCYDRECPPGWDLNFFTMIHSRNEEEFNELIATITQKYGLTEYKAYPTVRELKKTSMRYFQEETE